MSSSFRGPDDGQPAAAAGATAAGPPRDTTPAVGRSDSGTGVDRTLDRDTVVARQEDRFGGIKWGSAFFGWLTATGLAALLTTLLAAGGTAFGLSQAANAGQAVEQAADTATSAASGSASAVDTAQTIGITSAILLLVVLFLAYFAGGYVAGRMARFAGARQGVAVWLWAVLIAVVVAVLGAVAGSQYDVLSQLNLPRIPVNEGTLTTGGIIAVIAIALVTLLAAVLGGKTGMRYHRRVDDAGLVPTTR